MHQKEDNSLCGYHPNCWRWPRQVTSDGGSPRGGDDDDDDGGGGGGAEGGEIQGSVGVLLPDSKSSVRWETVDRPLLQKAFEDVRVEATIRQADEGKLDRTAAGSEWAMTNG